MIKDTKTYEDTRQQNKNKGTTGRDLKILQLQRLSDLSYKINILY